MCGIAGYVAREPVEGGESRLRAMTDALRHRGPDGAGLWTDDRCGLGHRRLSIIDVAAGAQPMTNEDESLWITYNGEIFNHAELRVDLERAGHVYRTRCDTETILHAYEQYGEDCPTRFRGMFAFAVWDRRRRRLFCVRDRLGIKPFYYWWDGRTFLFASEVKALLERPEVSAALDESMLNEHLAFGFSSDDRTLFRGVRKLLPGHTLTLDAEGEPRSESYWDVPRPESYENRPDEEWIRDTRERFALSVRQRLMSDVPLGMFLSGGVDSSAVAAVMKSLTDSPVKTFSVGYAEQEYSELDYAERTARALGVEHREVRIGPREFFGALPTLIWHEDEPLAWPSSVPLHFVSKLAAEHVKVVLTGEGSDELFAGYGRYRFYLLNERLGRYYGLAPEGLRRAVRRFVEGSSLLSADLRRKLGHTALGRDLNFASLYVENFHVDFSRAEQRRLLQNAALSNDDPYGAYASYWQRAADAPPLARLLYSDQKTYLVELLMKQDQMSMSASIESRVPFLDHSFVEFAATLPPHMKLRGGTGKYVFKKAAEGLIPAEVIERSKMGFPTPLRRWLLGPALEQTAELLRDPRGLLADYCDRRALDRLIDEHRAERIDATDRLWRLLNLQIWGEVFLKGRGPLEWGELTAAAPSAVS